VIGPLTDWLRDHLLPAAIVVIGAVLLLRIVRWVEHGLEQDIDRQIQVTIDTDDVAPEGLKRSRAMVQATSWAISALVVLAVGVWSAHLAGLPFTTLVAPATVIGVGLGFGAQQVIGDLLAGFFLLAEHQFGHGDVIRLGQPGLEAGVTGTVEEMTLRITKLRTPAGELVTVPNGALRQVTNLSKEWSRAVVDLPVAAGVDFAAAADVLRAAGAAMAAETPWSELMVGPVTVAGIERVEVGYVTIRVTVQTRPGRQFEVARELRLWLAAALDTAGIPIATIDWFKR